MRRVVPLRYILHAMRARGRHSLLSDLADTGTVTRVDTALTPTPPSPRASKSPSLLGPLSLRRLAALCLCGFMPHLRSATPLIAAAAAAAASAVVSDAGAAAAPARPHQRRAGQERSWRGSPEH